MASMNKAGIVRAGGGASAAQYPARMQLTMYRAGVGYLNNLPLAQTDRASYVATSFDGTDWWTFTLSYSGGIVWNLLAQSATVGGPGGYSLYRVDKADLPLDVRGINSLWVLEDIDPSNFFDELEIRVFPMPPNIYPQTA